METPGSLGGGSEEVHYRYRAELCLKGTWGLDWVMFPEKARYNVRCSEPSLRSSLWLEHRAVTSSHSTEAALARMMAIYSLEIFLQILTYGGVGAPLCR